MKSFEYGDNEIGTREIAFMVSNMVIGFGVLTLPRTLSSFTESSDGWMSLLLGGLLALGAGWIIAKLATRFPKMGFHAISVSVMNKPAANIATLLFAAYVMLFVSYEARGVANISKLYLFDRTPEEAVCLIFILVLSYGVAGPSIALLRLNLLFLPIVLLIVLVVLVMNIGVFNFHNLKPFFVSDWKSVLISTKETVFSFLGFEILLFYNAWINKPEGTKKAVTAGLLVPFILYLIVFIFVIGVFGAAVAQNTLYPTAELAKQVEIPGGFFERFESIFFTIWVMTLFNTAVMAFDVAIVALRSVMPKPQKITWIVLICPIVYLIAMQPQNVKEIEIFGQLLSYVGLAVGWGMPAGLLLTAKMRRMYGETRKM